MILVYDRKRGSGRRSQCNSAEDKRQVNRQIHAQKDKRKNQGNKQKRRDRLHKRDPDDLFPRFRYFFENNLAADHDAGKAFEYFYSDLIP